MPHPPLYDLFVAAFFADRFAAAFGSFASPDSSSLTAAWRSRSPKAILIRRSLLAPPDKKHQASYPREYEQLPPSRMVGVMKTSRTNAGKEHRPVDVSEQLHGFDRHASVHRHEKHWQPDEHQKKVEPPELRPRRSSVEIE
jgi:hypothetical protein